MPVTFSRRSLRDLKQIGEYIAADNPRRAASFIGELRKACELLATESDRHPLMNGSSVFRRMPVGNYLVFYRVAVSGIRISRVVHSARDLRDLDLD